MAIRLLFQLITVLVLPAAGEDKKPEADASEKPAAEAPSAIMIKPSDVVAAFRAESPFLLEQQLKVEKAQGKMMAARGLFDTRLEGDSKSVDKEDDKHSSEVGGTLLQPLGPANIDAYYSFRRTAGELPFYWDKEPTNQGGEFAYGMSIRPLQGLWLDKRRAEYRTQYYMTEATELDFRQKSLELTEKALALYFKWALSVEELAAFERLLEAALVRDGWLSTKVRTGARARIDLEENQRVILNRRAQVMGKRNSARIAYRDLNLFIGGALSENIDLLQPQALKQTGFYFPENIQDLKAWTGMAFAQRQDLKALAAKVKQREVEQMLQRQRVLPDVKLLGEVAQDQGASRDEFTGREFRLEGKLVFPLWMRDARGKYRAAKAEAQQAEVRLKYAKQQARTEILNSWDTLRMLRTQLEMKRKEFAIAEKLQRVEYKRYRLGDSSLININIREIDAIRALISLVQTKAKAHLEILRFHVLAGELPPYL